MECECVVRFKKQRKYPVCCDGEFAQQFRKRHWTKSFLCVPHAIIKRLRLLLQDGAFLLRKIGSSSSTACAKFFINGNQEFL